jgi:type IV pilus assembly protein PilV
MLNLNFAQSRHRARFTANGMTLVEVLVALVIISVGLLGVAALEITTLRSNQNSALRTQATALAQDISDRMRANRTAALAPNYLYNIALGSPANATATQDQRDLSEWKAALRTQLPPAPNGARADGSILVNANGVATITIQWGERRIADKANDSTTVSAATITFVTTTQI